jgi:hypothetical protein
MKRIKRKGMKKNENKGREMKTHDIINKTHKVGSIWK